MYHKPKSTTKPEIKSAIQGENLEMRLLEKGFTILSIKPPPPSEAKR